MALVEPEKKGGRYSRRQQEERRLQVFHYHFELDKSAVWISQELEVNRNTINADIQFLRTQVVDETGVVDIKAKMFQQIQKMEIQRDRLLNNLDECETTKETSHFEKLIWVITTSLERFYEKLYVGRKGNLEPSISFKEISENKLKELVLALMLVNKSFGRSHDMTENKIKFVIIMHSKQNMAFAENVFEKMKKAGLEVCKKPITLKEKNSENQHSTKYLLDQFAFMRGYATPDQLKTLGGKIIWEF